MKKLTFSLLAAFGISLLRASAAALGDPAAPLQIAEWVKGEAVDLASAKGKSIVVVEFWATWCGPCRQSIPHLTKMQRKYQEKGVVFVGVSDEPSATIKPFVDRMGEEMDYRVAADRDRKTFDAYMKAYGVNGIPHAFIVDRDGLIAWHGHPMDKLDVALDKILASSPPPAAGGQPAPNRLQELLALEKSSGGPTVPADQGSAQSPIQNRRLFQEYYRAVTGRGSPAAVADLTAKLESVRSQDTEFLTEVAWTLLTDEQIKTRDLKLALKFAQSAVDVSKTPDPDVLDTYARALFENGKVDEAIAQQQRAIDLTTDKDKKGELKQTLARYQKK